MADRSCPMCDAHTSASDRFCAACGVRLDAPVVLDGANPPSTTTTERVGSGGRLSAFLVPLLVLGVVALVAVVLFGGGDTQPDDTAGDTLADPPRTPTPEATPPPVAAATPTPEPTPTGTPTTMPVGLEASMDVAALPPTAATHLAVLKRNDVAFLDLRTGEWAVREVRGQSMSPDTPPWAFGRGIVTNAGGAVVYVPIDGEQTTLSQGWAVGATVDRVWINAGGERGVRAVVAIDTDGAIVDEFTPPPMTWVESALSTGELVVRGGGRLFLRSESEIRPVTDGETYGVVDTRALTQRCDDELACEFSIVDLVTGDATVLDLDLGAARFPQLVRGGIVVYGGENAAFYRIEGSSVIFDRDVSYQEADALFWGGPGQATDELGISAVIDGSVLRFEDRNGNTLTEASVDFLEGFGESSVLFITVADAS